jgi:hypothetical protein
MSNEDASRKEFEAWLKDTGRGWSEIAFAAWQAARQSNNVPPLFWLMDLDDDLTDIASGHFKSLRHDYPNSYLSCVEVPAALALYTSPQQSNALEMAHSECSACGSLTANSNEAEINNINKQLSSENERLRALIPQPESDGK